MTTTIQNQNQPLAPTLNAPQPVNQQPQAQNSLPPVTGQAPSATPPPVSGTPTADDYIAMARKLGLQEYEAVGQQLKTQAQQAGDIVARKVYGQNVGAESGVGKEIVSKSLSPILEYQQAEGNKIAARLSQSALENYLQKQATQDANKLTQDQQRLSATLNLIRAGNYTPTESEKAFLASQGFGGEIATDQAVAQKQFEQDLINKFGKNPATGQTYTNLQEALDDVEARGFDRQIAQTFGFKEDGSPYKSEQEAIQDWDRKANAGQLVQKFGLDPSTGKPFKSETEAALYFANQEALQNLNLNEKAIVQNRTAKYGVKPDGTPFMSDIEAEAYQTQKQIDQKYGKRANGSSFASEEEAIQNWDKKQFDQKLVQKFGVSPSGLPWPSEQAAINYFAKQGANADILLKYGTDVYGNPYKSEAEALRGEEDKKLSQALKSIPDPTLKRMINSLDEFNFYMETGKTYEGEIADIMRNTATIDAWKTKIPVLTDAMNNFTKQINAELAKGGNKDQMQIALFTQQRDLIKSVINDIYAGKTPIVSDEEFQAYGNDYYGNRDISKPMVGSIVPTQDEINNRLSGSVNIPSSSSASGQNSYLNSQIAAQKPANAIIESFQETSPGSGVFSIVRNTVPFSPELNSQLTPIIWDSNSNLPVYQTPDQYNGFKYDNAKRGYVRR